MEQFKLLIKEIKPIRYIITNILIFIFDDFIIDSLDKIGYVQWLDKLIRDTLTVYEDLSFLKYLKVMGMDILGLISGFAILYLMFYTFPNSIASAMGYDNKKRVIQMPRPKKDGRYLNLYLDRALHEEFEQFCERLGQTKTVAAERAFRMYMDAMKQNPEQIMKGDKTR